jgi:hypothetical protein
LQKQENTVRLEKLSAAQLEEERSRLETRLQEFAASVEAEKLGVQTSRGTVEERARLREIHLELNRVAQELDAVLASRRSTFAPGTCSNSCRSRARGFGAGALAALKAIGVRARFARGQNPRCQ